MQVHLTPTIPWPIIFFSLGVINYVGLFLKNGLRTLFLYVTAVTGRVKFNVALLPVSGFFDILIYFYNALSRFCSMHIFLPLGKT